MEESDPRTCPIVPGKETKIEIEKGKSGLGLSIVGGSDTLLVSEMACVWIGNNEGNHYDYNFDNIRIAAYRSIMFSLLFLCPFKHFLGPYTSTQLQTTKKKVCNKDTWSFCFPVYCVNFLPLQNHSTNCFEIILKTEYFSGSHYYP